MFLVTVKNAHTEKSEQYYCFHVEMGNNMLGFPKEGCKQVHLFCGTFGRDDSSITIETDEPVRIISEKYLDNASIHQRELLYGRY